MFLLLPVDAYGGASVPGTAMAREGVTGGGRRRVEVGLTIAVRRLLGQRGR